MSVDRTVKWESNRLAHWMISEIEDIYRDVLKMGVEDITGEDLDDTTLFDSKKIVYNNKIVEGAVHGSSSKLSVDATIALMLQYGDFYLPEEAKQFIKECYDNDELNLDNLPDNKDLYESGKAILDAFMEAGYSYYSACAMTGATFIECAWNVHVYNETERSGRGAPNTKGWENCGEGLFGLTFWSQKQKIIKKLGSTSPPVSSILEVYKKEVTDAKPFVHLCDLDETYWGKIALIYLDECAQKQNEKLAREELTSDTEYLESLAAGYLWKAGQGIEPEFEKAVDMSKIYQATHTRQNNGKPAMNNFAQQLCVSVLIDQYLHGEEKLNLNEIGITGFEIDLTNEISKTHADNVRDSFRRSRQNSNESKIVSLYTRMKEQQLKKKPTVENA